MIIENANARCHEVHEKDQPRREDAFGARFMAGEAKEEKKSSTLKRTQSTAESTRKNGRTEATKRRTIETNESSNGTERTSTVAGWKKKDVDKTNRYCRLYRFYYRFYTFAKVLCYTTIEKKPFFGLSFSS